MKYIDIAVKGGELEKVLDAKSFPVIITDGNVNDICLRFAFSDEWAAFGSICAVFSGSGKVKTVLVTDDLCLLPWECTEIAGGEVALTLEGREYDSDGGILRAMTTKRFTLGKIYDGDAIESDISVEPTPALANQVLAAVGAFDAAESAREAAEASRINAESSRATAETLRSSAETERAAAEALRVNAENSRASAETGRASAEASRVNAESAREAAETLRVNAESARASSFSTAISSAEEAAANASDAAALINNGLNAQNIAYSGVSGIEADNVKGALDELSAYVSGLAGLASTDSWADVQTAVRSGLAKKLFKVGDQFTVAKGNKSLVFDVIGIDAETPSDTSLTHSLTLQLHDCYANVQYDAPEALYYCENGLAAGTYHFSLLSGYDTANGGGKTLQFTLSQPVPAGGQIVFPWKSGMISTSVMISTYASAGAVTPIESDIAVTEGSGGTNLGKADGSLPNMNHTTRIRFGSNRWSDSAMRKWLNSTGGTGNWWSASGIFDRPPTNAASAEGFLSGLDSEFTAVLGNVKKTVVRNTQTDGGIAVTSDEKIFLPSRSEVYGGSDSSVSEGGAYRYYSDYSDNNAEGMSADGNRIKYLNGSPRYWWLRTCEPTTSYFVRYVERTGEIYRVNALAEYGASPVCCIV